MDLVHGFGLRAADIRLWHSRGIPVAVSTIYWDRDVPDQGADREMTPHALAARGAAGRPVRPRRRCGAGAP